jgi:hypothetical protein
MLACPQRDWRALVSPGGTAARVHTVLELHRVQASATRENEERGGSRRTEHRRQSKRNGELENELREREGRARQDIKSETQRDREILRQRQRRQRLDRERDKDRERQFIIPSLYLHLLSLFQLNVGFGFQSGEEVRWDICVIISFF